MIIIDYVLHFSTFTVIFEMKKMKVKFDEKECVRRTRKTTTTITTMENQTTEWHEKIGEKKKQKARSNNEFPE